jgi:hypothetical protein
VELLDLGEHVIYLVPSAAHFEVAALELLSRAISAYRRSPAILLLYCIILNLLDLPSRISAWVLLGK